MDYPKVPATASALPDALRYTKTSGCLQALATRLLEASEQHSSRSTAGCGCSQSAHCHADMPSVKPSRRDRKASSVLFATFSLRKI